MPTRSRSERSSSVDFSMPTAKCPELRPMFFFGSSRGAASAARSSRGEDRRRGGARPFARCACPCPAMRASVFGTGGSLTASGARIQARRAPILGIPVPTTSRRAPLCTMGTRPCGIPAPTTPRRTPAFARGKRIRYMRVRLDETGIRLAPRPVPLANEGHAPCAQTCPHSQYGCTPVRKRHAPCARPCPHRREDRGPSLEGYSSCAQGHPPSRKR
jgi:hypothetical protein